MTEFAVPRRNPDNISDRDAPYSVRRIEDARCVPPSAIVPALPTHRGLPTRPLIAPVRRAWLGVPMVECVIMQIQRLRTIQHPGRSGDRLDSPCDVLPWSSTGPSRAATAARRSALGRLPGRLIDLREALWRASGERRTPLLRPMTTDDVAAAARAIRCVPTIEHGAPQCA